MERMIVLMCIFFFSRCFVLLYFVFEREREREREKESKGETKVKKNKTFLQ